MKKYWFCLALMVLLTCPWAGEARAADSPAAITITLDGTVLNPEVAPVIVNNRTLVPIKTVAESLNLKVSWDASTREVTLEGKDLLIQMQIGSSQAYKNGSVTTLDAPPLIISGRTMLPLSFVSQALGCQVAWDNNARRIDISSTPVELKLLGYYALGSAVNSSWTDLFTVPYPQTRRGNTDLIDDLALCWYGMDEQGTLSTGSSGGWQRPDGWDDVLKAAGQYGLKTQMCVQMTDQNARIRKMINDPAARSQAILAITAEASGFNGVNLDFEGLGWNDTPEELSKVRTDFAGFVKDLAASLHAAGKTLTLSLHPLNSDYPGYDYASLGQAADSIVIMAYDYGTQPEPLDKVEQAVTLALAQVSASKLYLGISAASESASSLAGKIDLAEKYRLAGAALWRIGIVTDDQWALMRTRLAATT